MKKQILIQIVKNLTINKKSEDELYERLRILRLKIAKAENVRAFRVFSNRTLREICKAKPANKTEFLAVNGVGEVKLRNYGTKFLRALNKR